MKKFQLLVLLFISSLVHAESLPFSYAKKVGNILYLSGAIGTEKLGGPTLVPGGIEPETRQTMKNIQQILKQNGSSMDRVFKCTVMLADMKEWGAMNKAYVSFFPKGNFPARSAFGTTGLAFNARVEIECMARVD